MFQLAITDEELPSDIKSTFGTVTVLYGVFEEAFNDGKVRLDD